MRSRPTRSGAVEPGGKSGARIIVGVINDKRWGLGLGAMRPGHTNSLKRPSILHIAIITQWLDL